MAPMADDPGGVAKVADPAAFPAVPERGRYGVCPAGSGRQCDHQAHREKTQVGCDVAHTVLGSVKFPEKGIILNIGTPYLISPAPAKSMTGQATVPTRLFAFYPVGTNRFFKNCDETSILSVN